MHEHVSNSDGRWVMSPAVVGAFGIRRAANGSIQVIWTCLLCDYRTSPIPHHMADELGFVVRELSIVLDYAGQFGRCIVRGCESDDVELNHFAPRAIFGGEAENWPMGYLCRRHHREWGERVTPQLNRPNAA